MTAVEKVMNIKRELKADISLSFTTPIQSALYSDDGVIIHHTVGDNHFILQHPIEDNRPMKRYTITVSINKFLYASDIKVYIAFCNDLRLRVYNSYFELLATVPVSTNVLCLCYNKDTRELLAGGNGFIYSWTVQIEETNVLCPNTNVQFDIQQSEKVMSFSICHYSPLLCIACENGVYTFNSKNHHRQYYCSSSSVTCAAIYSPNCYIITAIKDGLMKVINYNTNISFSLFGHSKELISLLIHHSLPYLISSSKDKTLRLWHLETLTQCYIYSTHDVILSTMVIPNNDIVYYSKQHFITLKLHEVEELIAVLHSKIVHLSVYNHKNCERIVVLSDDGYIRLLCSSTGQCLTIVFPIVSAHMLKCVCYNFEENILYLSLQTGEILVFNADCNPCIPQELWIPLNSKQEVTCITIIDTVIGSLLIAGHSSGYLSVLYSKDCRNDQPCPAHNGAIINIAASNQMGDDPIVNVVTQGNDHLLQIWSIEIKNSRMSISKQLAIRNVTSIGCINMTPIHMKIIETCLCVATVHHKVIMYDISYQDTLYNTLQLLRNIEPMTHADKDDHCNCITSMTDSNQLMLFATSCLDGWIKIWNTQSQLITNIILGSPVSCACFAMYTQDLIIGFQNQLYKIPLQQCIPSMLQKPKHSTNTEVPLPFQSKLKFWYDSVTVPCIPLLPHTRHQTVVKPINPYTLRLISRPQFDQHNSAALCNARQLASVDPDIARTLSFKCQSKSRTVNASVGTSLSSSNVVSDVFSIRSDISEKDFLQYTKTFKLKSSHNLQLFPRQATLIPIIKTSKLHAVAPDGYIPNSLIRGKVAGYQPLSDEQIFEQILQRYYKQIEERPATAKSPHARKRARSGTKREETQVRYERVNFLKPISEDNTSEASVTTDLHKSRFRASSRLRSTAIRNSIASPVKQGASFAETVSSKSSSTATSVSSSSLSSAHTHESVSTIQSITEAKDSTTPNNDGFISDGKLFTSKMRDQQLTLKHKARSIFYKKQTKIPHILPLTTTDGKNLSSRSTPYIKEEKSAIIQFHSDIVIPKGHYDNETLIPYSQSKSTKYSTSSSSSSSKLIMSNSYFEESQELNDVQEQKEFVNNQQDNKNITLKKKRSGKLSQLEGLMFILNNIRKQSWYPSDTDISLDDMLEDSKGKIDHVVNSLFELLVTADSNVYEEVTKSIVTLDENKCINENQRKTAFEVVMKRMNSTSVSKKVKINTLNFLSEMGYASNESIMTLLPLLVDEDDDVKQSAFDALRELTGVTNRIGLHKLLIEKGILKHVEMNDDDVLNDLASRISQSQRDNQTKNSIAVKGRKMTVTTLLSHYANLVGHHHLNDLKNDQKSNHVTDQMTMGVNPDESNDTNIAELQTNINEVMMLQLANQTATDMVNEMTMEVTGQTMTTSIVNKLATKIATQMASDKFADGTSILESTCTGEIPTTDQIITVPTGQLQATGTTGQMITVPTSTGQLQATGTTGQMITVPTSTGQIQDTGTTGQMITVPTSTGQLQATGTTGQMITVPTSTGQIQDTGTTGQMIAVPTSQLQATGTTSQLTTGTMGQLTTGQLATSTRTTGQIITVPNGQLQATSQLAKGTINQLATRTTGQLAMEAPSQLATGQLTMGTTEITAMRTIDHGTTVIGTTSQLSMGTTGQLTTGTTAMGTTSQLLAMGITETTAMGTTGQLAMGATEITAIGQLANGMYLENLQLVSQTIDDHYSHATNHKQHKFSPLISTADYMSIYDKTKYQTLIPAKHTITENIKLPSLLTQSSPYYSQSLWKAIIESYGKSNTMNSKAKHQESYYMWCNIHPVVTNRNYITDKL